MIPMLEEFIADAKKAKHGTMVVIFGIGSAAIMRSIPFNNPPYKMTSNGGISVGIGEFSIIVGPQHVITKTASFESDKRAFYKVTEEGHDLMNFEFLES
jgi:hypothetical protein